MNSSQGDSEQPDPVPLGDVPAEVEVEPALLDWDQPLPPLPAAQPKEGELVPPVQPVQLASIDSDLPRWLQSEIAWPLALLAGFLGSSAGIKTGLPGVGSFMALFLFAPLYFGLISRHRARMAAFVTVGWMAAVGAATAGSVLEVGFSEVAHASPGAYGFRDMEIRPWLEGERLGPAEWNLARNVLLGAVLLLLARPSFGLATLLGLGLVASSVGAGMGWFATETVSMEPAMACIMAIPPHRAFVLTGIALGSAVLTDRRPLRPLGAITDERRSLLLVSLVLMASGYFLEPWLVTSWGSWMSEALG